MLSDFEKTVWEMRKAQKQYAETPHNQNIQKAELLRKKNLKESFVDKHLREKLNPML